MSFVKDSILFSKNLHSLIENDPFVLCDIGARGELTEPWKTFNHFYPKLITILAFEPDQQEFQKLNEKPKNNIKYFPYALWNSEKNLKIHIVKNESSSSIHPPNHDLLADFDPIHGDIRQIKNSITVSAKTLDGILDSIDYDVDFIKIDTQGSEYEILEGSKKVLENLCFGCTLETWTMEIHKNQHLSFEIMKFMHDYGFLFFDLQIGATWGRNFSNKIPLKSNRQIVGLDFLYLKNSAFFYESNPKLSKVVKAVAISDVWGFPDYAIQLIEKYEKIYNSTGLSSLKNEIIKRRSKNLIKNPKLNKIFDILKTKVFKINPSFPNIH